VTQIVVFRCDASAHIGAGHVMRCAALAETFRARGWTTAFLVDAETERYVPHIALAGATVLVAPEAIGDQLTRLRAAFGTIDLVVVDSYRLDREHETAFRNVGARVLVFDDIDTRPHDCDWLLDASQDLSSQKYLDLVPSHCIRLFGPSYVCVRSEIKIYRDRRETGEGTRVFVSFGSSDAGGGTQLTLDAVALMEPPPYLVVATSGANPITQTLQSRKNLTLLLDTTDIGPSMAASNVALGAGGVAAWERCFLGLPSIILTTADNQLSIAKMIAGEEAATYLGSIENCSPLRLASELRGLLDDPERQQEMRTRGRRLVDGRGGDRVVEMVSA
jgi:UDP-2,4-diacetamido-2,4,6-trideoxy-beta-L-altropyranose hydrolase